MSFVTTIRSGQVYLSDVSLIESGGPVDIETSPLPALVERLARRQRVPRNVCPVNPETLHRAPPVVTKCR